MPLYEIMLGRRLRGAWHTETIYGAAVVILVGVRSLQVESDT